MMQHNEGPNHCTLGTPDVRHTVPTQEMRS